MYRSMKSISEQKKLKYGYYYFRPYMAMLVFFTIVGLGLVLFMPKNYQPIFYIFGIGIFLYGVLTTIGWAFARYVIPGSRIEFARNIVTSLSLTGKELVLDVGSGRGLYAIEAAKALTTGKVIAIDIWDSNQLPNVIHHHKLSQPTGNTIRNAQRNAKIENVEDRIQFINMDANNLELDSDKFDLAICGFVIGHLGRYGHNALGELKRVLKPGGRLVLIDNFRDFTYFLLSTPHLFVLSYLRGTKARRLTKKNWVLMLKKSGFHILTCGAQKGILVITAVS